MVKPTSDERGLVLNTQLPEARDLLGEGHRLYDSTLYVLHTHVDHPPNHLRLRQAVHRVLQSTDPFMTASLLRKNTKVHLACSATFITNLTATVASDQQS